jgi:hypothetical protein
MQTLRVLGPWIATLAVIAAVVVLCLIAGSSAG